MKKLVVVGWLLLVPAFASAAPCETQQKKFMQVVNQLSDLARRSGNQFVSCLYGGTNDAAIRKLAKEIRGTISMLNSWKPSGMKECAKVQVGVPRFVNQTAKATGERFGFAVIACTKEAQKISKSKKLSTEARKKKLSALMGKYLK